MVWGDVGSVLQCGVLDMWALWHDVVCRKHEFSGTMWCGERWTQCYNVVCWRCGLCGMMWCVGDMSSVVQCGWGDVGSVLQCGVLDMWTLWHDMVCRRHEFMVQCGVGICGVGICGLYGMMWCMEDMSLGYNVVWGRCCLSTTMWCG